MWTRSRLFVPLDDRTSKRTEWYSWTLRCPRGLILLARLEMMDSGIPTDTHSTLGRSWLGANNHRVLSYSGMRGVIGGDDEKESRTFGGLSENTGIKIKLCFKVTADFV